MVFTARNPIGARPGDMVTVESATGPVLKAAAVLYLMPLVLFIAGYLVYSAFFFFITKRS